VPCDDINRRQAKALLKEGERNEIGLLPYTTYGNCRDIIAPISARECALAAKRPNRMVSWRSKR
jgi:hypothetical protein